MSRLLLAASLCLVASLAFAGGADLTPREVRFSARELPLRQALKEIEKQTGNPIADRRTQRDNPTLKLPAGPRTFWQALDALGLGYSAYQSDGGVALIDRALRQTPTSDSGLFRFTLKRIAVSRDEETQAHQCDVTLDVAWEPRLQLLQLNLEKAEVRFAGQHEKLPRQSPRSAAGASAGEIELRMKAPKREIAKLDSLQGELRVLGAPKLLDFTFTNPAKGNSAVQDGVKATLIAVEKSKMAWVLKVRIEHPAGAIVPLESFQALAWLDLNRVELTWPNHSLAPEPADEKRTAVGKAVEVEYGFPSPPSDAPVTLRLRTPNRLQAFSASFEFRDLRLP